MTTTTPTAAAIPKITLNQSLLGLLHPSSENPATHGPYAKLTVTGNKGILDLTGGVSQEVVFENASDFKTGGLVTFNGDGEAVGYIPNPETVGARRTSRSGSRAVRADL